MRVVANYSTSLFDYINSDKNLKEVLSQGADESLLSEGAKKTLREKGISLNGSTTKDASVYETVQETAESVRLPVQTPKVFLRQPKARAVRQRL